MPCDSAGDVRNSGVFNQERGGESNPLTHKEVLSTASKAEMCTKCDQMIRGNGNRGGKNRHEHRKIGLGGGIGLP